MSAIERVMELYQEKPEMNFARDLDDYLRTGVVVALPDNFGMLKAVELADGRRAWFVQAVAGELRQLVRLIPWPLPFIAFCRRRDERVRVYPFARFLRKAL